MNEQQEPSRSNYLKEIVWWSDENHHTNDTKKKWQDVAQVPLEVFLGIK